MSINAYYFGCWRDTGHYLWAPGMANGQADVGRLWGRETWARIDGLFVPNQAGVARLSVMRGGPFEGWSFLSMQDNTVDKRPGSHSTFALMGAHDWASALEHSERVFPEVCARIGLRDAAKAGLR
jgi:hypothetical protein